MNDSHMISIAQIKEFAKLTENIEFKASSRKEKYEWIEEVLARFKYFSLKKKNKSIVKSYMIRMTSFSDAQITRLVAKKKRTGKIAVNYENHHSFTRTYTTDDIGLLIETDNAHNCISGPATKTILQRAYDVFKDQRFARLKNISISHIYNLRGTRQYISWAKFFTKTKPVQVNIGERRKPNPQGIPGYLRVDTVHQGDLDKEKGVYHINLIDDVTQWEIVGAVEKISEQYLVPLIETLLKQYPYRILGFHSDNGSEFINKTIARLLQKLLIAQTKSRSRHCNDNALVEGKNGSIIRKNTGYCHIPQKYAELINEFYEQYFNVYLNYHRPCGYASEVVDSRGKVKKIYNNYMTPYDKFRSINNASQYLKDGITFEELDKIAYAKSDNDYAKLVQDAKVEMFKKINKKTQFLATHSELISGSLLN